MLAYTDQSESSFNLIALIALSGASFHSLEEPAMDFGRRIATRREPPASIGIDNNSNSNSTTVRPRRRFWHIFAIAVAGLVLFSVYGDRPLVAEPWQWDDDGLYFRQSEAFVLWLNGAPGPWLGPYDAILLSKTPLFAIWLGFLNVLHLPLRPAEFGLLLVLPWLFRFAVRPMFELKGWRWVIVSIILVALPFLPQEQRMLRTALHAALSSACLISAIGLILRARHSSLKQVLWAGLTGFFLSLSYLNREESIWLLPAVGCTLIALAAGACCQRAWRPAAVSAASLLGAFFIPVAVVSALNFYGYGVMLTTMRRAPAFTRAHQVMTSLEPETRERFVPIRTATRLKAYQLSPTFARLQPHLEGPITDSIARNAGHLELNGRSLDTREFFVSNFQPVLHEAAFQAGAHTAPASEAMFSDIERELKSAVAAGKIAAGNHGPALLAAPMQGDYGRILSQTFVAVRKLFTLDSMAFPPSGISSGAPGDLSRISNFTHMRLAPVKGTQKSEFSSTTFGVRSAVFSFITKLEAVVYALGAFTVFAFAMITVARHQANQTQMEQAIAGLVLCGSVVSFSFSIAVVDVLGVPLLQHGSSYNCLGYIPLSVLGAFGLVILMAYCRPWTVCKKPGSRSCA